MLTAGSIIQASARAPLHEEIAAAKALSHRLGLGASEPVLVKAANHTTLRLAPLGMVARIKSSLPVEEAMAAAERELRVGRHLAARSAPVVEPLEHGLAGPHVVGECVATLWPHIDHEPLREDGDVLGAAQALARIHEALRDYPGELPPYTESLDRCWAVLDVPSDSPALLDDDRRFLQQRYRSLREPLQAALSAEVPLHGDIHIGNVMVTAKGPIWADFEAACRGPIERDVAGLPPAARALFPQADPQLTAICAELRSVCVAAWCWADVFWSDEVREAAEYHLRRFRRMNG